jgi:hypothetical protein
MFLAMMLGCIFLLFSIALLILGIRDILTRSDYTLFLVGTAFLLAWLCSGFTAVFYLSRDRRQSLLQESIQCEARADSLRTALAF